MKVEYERAKMVQERVGMIRIKRESKEEEKKRVTTREIYHWTYINIQHTYRASKGQRQLCHLNFKTTDWMEWLSERPTVAVLEPLVWK
ncbi:hypothetical protein IGI04_027029 [Brassica rapa subsp. trilocularis]|uniref:Uncharacterized protein n=1 Tax=Brassica rapa subsp. trilocularis TaxID=1813537 RepID=A0ABQ7KY09_BRACM|nr:hypothetical protein IGI04_027029 [Brassica rapa subsp. trilocularis]